MVDSVSQVCREECRAASERKQSCYKGRENSGYDIGAVSQSMYMSDASQALQARLRSQK